MPAVPYTQSHFLSLPTGVDRPGAKVFAKTSTRAFRSIPGEVVGSEADGIGGQPFSPEEESIDDSDYALSLLSDSP